METDVKKGERKSLENLIERYRKGAVVPFIGAGFSMAVCPGWGNFLADFFDSEKDHTLLNDDIAAFEQLEEGDDVGRFEVMAQLLSDGAETLRFKQAIETAFHRLDEESRRQIQSKFQLLNRVFPALKVTTNFDCLIEENHNGHVEVIRDNFENKLDTLFNPSSTNKLVKIHGCVTEPATLVLNTEQYDNAYGDTSAIDEKKIIPNLLLNLFKTRNVLFIGCSLQADRWLKLLDRREGVADLFAIYKRETDPDEQKKLTQHLSRHMIHPIWIDDFPEIENILRTLSPSGPEEE